MMTELSATAIFMEEVLLFIFSVSFPVVTLPEQTYSLPLDSVKQDRVHS